LHELRLGEPVLDPEPFAMTAAGAAKAFVVKKKADYIAVLGTDVRFECLEKCASERPEPAPTMAKGMGGAGDYSLKCRFACEERSREHM
jgi:hypothetical protein